ncbi:MAG: twin-arginine translocase TatA/TatE family subunit [Candidatus Sericytochromatia bacterium]|nr:twin-arginine translocase TatA/TatE family subunit [Candidatus Sericytochromatia bacterium]
MVSTTSAIVIGAVALLVVGPRKLPELARGLGKAMGEFRKGIHGLEEGDSPPSPQASGDKPDAHAPKT